MKKLAIIPTLVLISCGDERVERRTTEQKTEQKPPIERTTPQPVKNVVDTMRQPITFDVVLNNWNDRKEELE